MNLAAIRIGDDEFTRALEELESIEPDLSEAESSRPSDRSIILLRRNQTFNRIRSSASAE